MKYKTYTDPKIEQDANSNMKSCIKLMEMAKEKGIEEMKKEFNLSEKIRFMQDGDIIEVKNVKEFIERLKGVFLRHRTDDFIDKLAGEKLK